MASNYGYAIQITLLRYERGDAKESIELRNYYHGDAAPTQAEAEALFAKVKETLQPEGR